MKKRLSKKKIALVFGTRPEIIKLSPLIRLLHQNKHPYFMIHTGQHYTYEMDRLFFKELGLPEPRYQFMGCSKTANRHGEHTARMMTEVEMALMKERPQVVFVQGDTNSVLAGSLVAAKIKNIRLGHVEAGLRSFDRSMPEEINRVVSDHLSDYLFTPTQSSKKLLLGEGIAQSKIFVTGNTIVDAVKQNLQLALKKTRSAHYLPGPEARYFLMTLHRQENVDHRQRLAAILKGLDLVIKRFGMPIVFPIHPRTRKNLEKFRMRLPENLKVVKPVGFLDFLRWESAARLILSDSGGVQEEACILGVPCVTLRTSTERPETVQVGANLVAGYRPEGILRSTMRMMKCDTGWKNPFGDGQAAQRILAITDGAP